MENIQKKGLGERIGVEKYFWQLLVMISALAGFIVYQNKREFNSMEQRWKIQQKDNLEAHKAYAKEIANIYIELKKERDAKDSLFKLIIIEQTLNRIKK